jgi:L-ribulose-5-phosphate 4-epimerase
VTPDMRELAEGVVTCTRLLVAHGILDYSGHVSARLPGTGNVLIQPKSVSRAALTAADLLVVDLDGHVVDGRSEPPLETAIHTAVYRARADVGFVCHGHPTLAAAFSMSDAPLRPLRHFAYVFGDALAIHPDPTHIRTRKQGDAVAATLGGAPACLLRSHGTVVAADSVEKLLMRCVDLEENARTQLYAVQLGTIRPLTDQEMCRLADDYGTGQSRAEKMWDHYVHKYPDSVEPALGNR